MERVGDVARVLEITISEGIKSSEDLSGAMKLATELGITFYDASYLYAAKIRKGTLVTEDKELASKAADAGVKATTVTQLLGDRLQTTL